VAQRYGLSWLLAHADDGVVWGACVDTDSGLRLAVQPTPPTLRLTTLQMARLFAPHAELLLWREGIWRARLVRDHVQGEEARPDGTMLLNEAFDEAQILWGDRTTRAGTVEGVAFVTMSDGAQGLRHTVPLAVPLGRHDKRPLRLHVRHYVAEDGGTLRNQQGGRSAAHERAFDKNEPGVVPGLTRVVLSRLCDLRVDPSTRQGGNHADG